jgi:predicted MFS family arabinose efflux permease
MGTTISLAVLAGMGLGGALGSLLGVRPVLALAGGIDLGFGLLALVMLHRTALHEMGADTAPREEPVTSVPE